MSQHSNIAGCLITLFEASLLLLLGTLEYLAGYKMGVMQHLYYKKIEYMDSIFSLTLMPFHWILFSAMLFWLGFRYIKRKAATPMLSYLIVLAAAATFALSTYLPSFTELYIQAYLLMALECILLLEAVRLWLRR